MRHVTHPEGAEMPQPRIHASQAHRQAAYRQRTKEAREQQLQEKGLRPVPALPNVPGIPRWQQAIDNAVDLLSIVADEMSNYFDDRSEQWQESDKGERFRERLDALCEARDAIVDLPTLIPAASP